MSCQGGISKEPVPIFLPVEENDEGRDSDSFPPPVIGKTDANFFEESLSCMELVDGDGISMFKRFRPKKRGKAARDCATFSFGSVTPQIGTKGTTFSAYKMDSHPHGIAVIINNENFKSKPQRIGTKVDEENLVQALRFLGYEVELHNDCSAKQILNILKNIQKRDHSKYDSFICCILSHGKSGGVYGTDESTVSLDDITSLLSGERCKSLVGKPKVIFVQACRGSSMDRGVHVEADGGGEVELDGSSQEAERTMSDGDLRLPSTSDFFYGYATTEGYVAWRNSMYGSWYISELCQSLISYAPYASLTEMVTITNDHVCSRVSTDGKFKASSQYTSNLRKKVFF